MQEISVKKSEPDFGRHFRQFRLFLAVHRGIPLANMDICRGVLYNENNEKKGLYSEETRKKRFQK